MSVVAQLAIFPMDKGPTSLAPYVARSIAILERSGLPFALGPMGTSVEGEFDEVMAVAGRCFEAIRQDSSRVYMTLAVDYKAGRTGGLTSKTASVQAALEGRK